VRDLGLNQLRKIQQGLSILCPDFYGGLILQPYYNLNGKFFFCHIYMAKKSVESEDNLARFSIKIAKLVELTPIFFENLNRVRIIGSTRQQNLSPKTH
jgi:uncharacterized protein (DUF983 family)